jgi:16S rRNA (guanine527-N7)-methyltransferase
MWNETAAPAKCSTWNTIAPSDSECSTWNTPGTVPVGAAQNAAKLPASLLDFGSGAGFPGLPIQILWPELRVTLAESRHKKAAFLRETVRFLGLKTEIWADRVETMPTDRKFPVVTMRAVDQMSEAVAAAARRTSDALLILGTTDAAYAFLAPEFSVAELTPIPETNDGVLMLFRRA